MNGCFDPLFCPWEKLQQSNSKRDTFKQPDKDSPCPVLKLANFGEFERRGGKFVSYPSKSPPAPSCQAGTFQAILFLLRQNGEGRLWGLGGRAYVPPPHVPIPAHLVLVSRVSQCSAEVDNQPKRRNACAGRVPPAGLEFAILHMRTEKTSRERILTTVSMSSLRRDRPCLYVHVPVSS